MKCPKCNAEFEFPDDMDVSHSAFGQHVHDKYPNTFYWMDLDGIVWKRATRVLRVIEHKKLGQELKGSQKAILPLLAMGIDWLIKSGYVAATSGVFIVYSDAPYESASVSQVYPPNRKSLIKRVFSFTLVDRYLPGFLLAEQVNIPDVDFDDIAFILDNYNSPAYLSGLALEKFISGETDYHDFN